MSFPTYTQHTVFQRRGFGVKESCLQREDGAFVGIETGSVYAGAEHYGRPRRVALIGSVEMPRETGMVHLDTDEGIARRERYLGCYVAVERAHRCGENLIYYSADVNDYFAEHELRFED